MKKLAYLLALLTATACSNDDNEVQIDNRTPITFSATTGTEVVSSPITRATTAEGTGFTARTRIVMRMKSESSDNNLTTDRIKYSRTVATAAINNTNNNVSEVSFATNSYQRYWDDAHGRNSQLSIYAVAVENKDDENLLKEDELYKEGSTDWSGETSPNENIEWEVKTTQTADDIEKENLVYSNNISQNGTGGVVKDNVSGYQDGCMRFIQDVTGHGKFDRGHLVFRHALTRITVNLTPGEGFTDSSNNPTWSSVSGKILGAPYKGTLDISTGNWSSSNSTDVSMHKVSSQEFTAQILPGRIINNKNDDNVITFDIDNNVYFITAAVLHEKLNSITGALDNDNKLVQGKHYIINTTIKKTGIDVVSATLVNWSDVTISEVVPRNDYITLSLYEADGEGDASCSKFDLYRLEQKVDNPNTSNDNPTNLNNWSGDYSGNKAELTNTENNIFSTKWYFESNKHYYHFRTVNQNETLEQDANSYSYFTIKSGFDTNSTAYDPHWGAPMKSGNAPSYNPEKGFADYIHSAIGATSDPIKITEFHMLSYVYVQLKSVSATDAKQQVTLDGATVQLLQLGNEAKVDMGSGLISVPTSTNLTQKLELMTEAGTSNKYFSPIVPQALNSTTSSTGTVGIKIITTDGNVYQVDNISTYQSGSETVTRWLPGHKYTYTFNILKTGINTVTCTVTNWQDVNVNGGNVTIE